jgi:hypothetical protein
LRCRQRHQIISGGALSCLPESASPLRRNPPCPPSTSSLPRRREHALLQEAMTGADPYPLATNFWWWSISARWHTTLIGHLISPSHRPRFFLLVPRLKTVGQQ